MGATDRAPAPRVGGWPPWPWRWGGLAPPRAGGGNAAVTGRAAPAPAPARRRFPWQQRWRADAPVAGGASANETAGAATPIRFPWLPRPGAAPPSAAAAAGRAGGGAPRVAFRFPWQRPPPPPAAAAPGAPPGAAPDAAANVGDPAAAAAAPGVRDGAAAAAAAAPRPSTATAPRLYLEPPSPPTEAPPPPPPLSPSNVPVGGDVPAGDGDGTAAFPRTAYEVPLPLPRRALTLTVVPVAAPKQLKRSAAAVVAAFGPAAAGLLARAVRGGGAGGGVAAAHAATAPPALCACGCVAEGKGAAAAAAGAASGAAAAVAALGAPVSAAILPVGELLAAAAARVRAALPALPPLLVLPPTSLPERILAFALFLLLPELARIVWRDLHHSDIALRTASASPPLLARITTPVHRHTALVVVTGAAYLAGLYVAALSSVVGGGLLVLAAGLVFNLSARVKVREGRVEAVGVRQRGDVLVANALAAALVGGVGLLGGGAGIACATGGLALVVCYWAVRYVFVLSPGGVVGRRRPR